MSNLAKIHELPSDCAPKKVEFAFKSTKAALNFENTIENPLVFRCVEEALLETCELKWTGGTRCGIM